MARREVCAVRLVNGDQRYLLEKPGQITLDEIVEDDVADVWLAASAGSRGSVSRIRVDAIVEVWLKEIDEEYEGWSS